MNIRRMVRPDTAKVADIDKATSDTPWMAEDYQEIYRDRYVDAFVAEDETGVIGFALTFQDLFADEIVKIAVQPDKTRRGIGSSLVEKLRSMQDENWKSLEVLVPADRVECQVFFANCGFRCVADCKRNDKEVLKLRRGNRFKKAPDLKYRISTHSKQLGGDDAGAEN